MARPSSICHCGSKRNVKEHPDWYGYHCPKCHDGGSIPKRERGGNVHQNFLRPRDQRSLLEAEAEFAAPVLSALDKAEQFFQSTKEKAQLDSAPNFLSGADDKFFCSVIGSHAYGFKAIEIFQNEIQANLEAFAYSSNTILYRTQKFWYKFTLNLELNIIEITCFEKDSDRRWDSWMNKHSCTVGGEFLKAHVDKRVNTVIGPIKTMID